MYQVRRYKFSVNTCEVVSRVFMHGKYKLHSVDSVCTPRALLFHTPTFMAPPTPPTSHPPPTSQLCTCDYYSEGPSIASLLSAALPPLGCLPAANRHFLVGHSAVSVFFFFFLHLPLTHCFSLHCFCGGNHLLSCEKGVRRRGRYNRGS